MRVAVPRALAENVTRIDGDLGRSWLHGLPNLVTTYLARWSLTPDLPAGAEPWHGYVGLVVPVRSQSGTRCVLKISLPDADTAFEHVALGAWGGRGAVSLLAADTADRALLLERLDPYRTLQHEPVDAAVDALGAVLSALDASGPAGLTPVADVAARWCDELPADAARLPGAVPARLLDVALSTARDLRSTAVSRVLHTDLHYANVLAGEVGSGRDGWFAIDPKPLAGPAEFEVAPALWNRLDDLGSGDPGAALRRRLRRLCAAAGLDVGLAAACTVLREVDNALWYAERGLEDDRRRSVRVASAVVSCP